MIFLVFVLDYTEALHNYTTLTHPITQQIYILLARILHNYTRQLLCYIPQLNLCTMCQQESLQCCYTTPVLPHYTLCYPVPTNQHRRFRTMVGKCNTFLVTTSAASLECRRLARSAEDSNSTTADQCSIHQQTTPLKRHLRATALVMVSRTQCSVLRRCHLMVRLLNQARLSVRSRLENSVSDSTLRTSSLSALRSSPSTTATSSTSGSPQLVEPSPSLRILSAPTSVMVPRSVFSSRRTSWSTRGEDDREHRQEALRVHLVPDPACGYQEGKRYATTIWTIVYRHTNASL